MPPQIFSTALGTFLVSLIFISSNILCFNAEQFFRPSHLTFTIKGLRNSVQIIGSVIQLFLLSSKLTGALAMGLPILYALGNLYGSYLRSISARAKVEESLAIALAGEVLFF